MGVFSSISRAIARPFESAGRSIADNVSDLNDSSLFGGKSSLVRSLLNPADPIAVGQTLNRTAVQGDSPSEVVRDSDGQVRVVVKKVEYFHNELANSIWDGISSGWHSVFDEIKRAWSDVGGEKHWNQLASTLSHTVDKWGGEQKVVGWVIVGVCVIIYVLVVVFSWGSLSAPATAGLVAVLAAFGSYGLQMGLAPRDAAKEATASLFYGGSDNSVYTAIDAGSGSGGSQSASGPGGGGFMDGLQNLPPLAIAGAAVVSALGVWYLLAR